MEKIKGDGYVLELKDGYEDSVVIVGVRKNKAGEDCEVYMQGNLADKMTMISIIMVELADVMQNKLGIPREVVKQTLLDLSSGTINMWGLGVLDDD